MTDNRTVDELQRHGLAGDDKAIIELGRRMLHLDFCGDHDKYCEHRYELGILEDVLNNEIPPECPKCGAFID